MVLTKINKHLPGIFHVQRSSGPAVPGHSQAVNVDSGLPRGRVGGGGTPGGSQVDQADGCFRDTDPAGPWRLPTWAPVPPGTVGRREEGQGAASLDCLADPESSGKSAFWARSVPTGPAVPLTCPGRPRGMYFLSLLTRRRDGAALSRISPAGGRPGAVSARHGGNPRRWPSPGPGPAGTVPNRYPSPLPDRSFSSHPGRGCALIPRRGAEAEWGHGPRSPRRQVAAALGQDPGVWLRGLGP